MIADLVGDRQLLPLSLGVFGGWGTGKSTILNLVELELSKNSQDYLVIKFDAWLYQDFDDARAALMGVISSAIVDSAPNNLKDKALKTDWTREQASIAWSPARRRRFSARGAHLRSDFQGNNIRRNHA